MHILKIFTGTECVRFNFCMNFLAINSLATRFKNAEQKLINLESNPTLSFFLSSDGCLVNPQARGTLRSLGRFIQFRINVGFDNIYLICTKHIKHIWNKVYSGELLLNWIFAWVYNGFSYPMPLSCRILQILYMLCHLIPVWFSV